MQWKKLFADYILNRGYHYYKDGRVEIVRQSNNRVIAYVYGSDQYEVKIQMDNKSKLHMSCDCPYAKKGYNCKHMASVMYKWQNESFDYGALWNKIEFADIKMKDDFLFDILSNDISLYDKFNEILKGKKTQQEIDKLIYQIDNIEEDEEYFINLEKFVDHQINHLLEIKDYDAAFELTNHIYYKALLAAEEYDDGFDLAESIQDIWSVIIDKSDDERVHELFDWFADKSQFYDSNVFEEIINVVLFNSFKQAEYIYQKINICQKHIDTLDDSEHLAAYQSYWIFTKLALLKEFGEPEEIQEEFLENYLYNICVFNEVLTDCMNREEYENALFLIDDYLFSMPNSLEMEKMHRKRKDVLKLMNANEEYINELWDLVTKYAKGDIKLYKELKQQYDTTTWKEKRNIVYNALKDYENIGDIYREEYDYRSLMTYVEESSGLSRIQRYRSTLSNHRPKQLLNKYRKELDIIASTKSNRETYHLLANHLEYMLTIPGGQTVVKEITDEWQKKYHRRTAMMEELQEIIANI